MDHRLATACTKLSAFAEGPYRASPDVGPRAAYSGFPFPDQRVLIGCWPIC